jgi:hypothetical protein
MCVNGIYGQLYLNVAQHVQDVTIRDQRHKARNPAANLIRNTAQKNPPIPTSHSSKPNSLPIKDLSDPYHDVGPRKSTLQFEGQSALIVSG